MATKDLDWSDYERDGRLAEEASKPTVWVAALATDRETTLYAAATKQALLLTLNAEFELLDLATAFLDQDALEDAAAEAGWTLTVDEVAL